ncbi:MAG: hypothetical protein ACREP4_14230 [Stenotrophomonas sp.]
MRTLAYAAPAADTSPPPLRIERRALRPDVKCRFVIDMASPQGRRA